MTTSELRTWLKDNGRDRHWLASRCGVSKHTVDGWFAGRPIPAIAWKTIEGIVGSPPEITATMDLATWKAVQAAAAEKGISIDEFIARVVREAVGLE